MSSAPALGVPGVSRSVIRELIEPLDERCELTSAMPAAALPAAALPVRACSAAPPPRLSVHGCATEWVESICSTGQERLKSTLNSAVLTGVQPENPKEGLCFLRAGASPGTLQPFGRAQSDCGARAAACERPWPYMPARAHGRSRPDWPSGATVAKWSGNA